MFQHKHTMINAYYDSIWTLKFLWIHSSLFVINRIKICAQLSMPGLSHTVRGRWRHLFWRLGLGIPICSCHFNHVSFPPSQRALAPVGLVAYLSVSFVPLWYVKEDESQSQQRWMQTSHILSGLRLGHSPPHCLCSQRPCLLGISQCAGVLLRESLQIYRVSWWVIFP